jgi:hypothetical protein
MSMQTVFACFKRATLFPLLLCALSLQTPLALPAQAAEFPAKPVRIILPYPPGSGTDAFARVLAAGGSSLKAPHKTSWGGYVGHFADPDGHLWEVAHNPFFPLHASGAVSVPPPRQGGQL